MKKIVEVSDEGLEGLMGDVVTLFCANYFYTGTLTGVNSTCVQLTDPSIVYETGSWANSDWENAEKLPTKSLYVQCAAIEAFGVLK